MKTWEKTLIITILFAIALSSGIMLSRQIDTQINKIQKGQQTMNLGPLTYNTIPLADSYQNTSGSLQGGASTPIYTTTLQGSTPTIQGSQIDPTNYTASDSGQVQGYVAPDPYAQWGGQNAYNNLLSGFNTQKQNIYGSANDAATNLQGGLNIGIQDTIRGFQRGQDTIDRKSTQNESSRIQGGRDILSMVGRGIRSGGTQLAQRNAGSSSAAQAIANAYAQLGQRQASVVGNQYAQNADEIGLAQRYQNEDVAAAPDKFNAELTQNVNGIVNSARDQFAQLDAAMANASLPDRIAIEQEKEAVRAQVLAKLSQYDSQLRTGLGGVQATGREANIAKANTQISAGQADPNLFRYNTQTPAQFQNTGPFASELPIFTYNGKNRQTA